MRWPPRSPACCGCSCSRRASASSRTRCARPASTGTRLLDAGQAMALIVMAAVWKQISYNFLFFLAGLQSIPKSLIEAAAIDGAGPWRRFWTIVFPLLSPTTFFLLVINIIYAFFDTFGIIDAATEGGPGKDTAVLVYKLYYDGFKALDLGGSAAQSVVLMAIVIDAHRHPVPLHREQGELLRWSSAAPSSTSSRTACCSSACSIVAFPVYLTFVASTHTRAGDHPGADAAPARRPVPAQLRRRPHRQRARPGLGRAGRPHDVGEPGLGAGHRDRQDRDLAALGVRDRLLPLPVQAARLLDDLRDADAAGRGAHLSDLPGHLRPRHAQQLRRPDHPADRLGDGDLPVPPVLHDRPRRARRGGARRRRRADALLQGRPRAALGDLASPRSSSSSSSTAGTSTCGRCW